MSKVQSPEPKVSTSDHVDAGKTDIGHWTLDVGLVPDPDELAVLNWFERLAFRLVKRMNQGYWKRFWTWCQKVFGQGGFILLPTISCGSRARARRGRLTRATDPARG